MDQFYRVKLREDRPQLFRIVAPFVEHAIGPKGTQMYLRQQKEKKR